MPPSIALLLFLRAALPLAGPSAEPVKEPALLRELVEREKRDQQVRFEFLEWMNRQQPRGADGPTRAANVPEAAERLLDVTRRMKEIDADNREWMKRVVAEHGWPGRSLVGANGARIAWLLVQHADADPEFQEHCLGLMEKMPRGEVERGHLAYLTDRVRVNTGRKQLFGTQMTWESGKLAPKPIEDAARVDQRRAEYGLPPLADYLRRSEEAMRNPREN